MHSHRLQTSLSLALIVSHSLSAQQPAPDPYQSEIVKMQNAKSYDKSKEAIKAAFPQLTILETKGGLIAYLPRLSKVINKRRGSLNPSHPLFFNTGLEENDILLMETQIKENDPTLFYLLFSEGPSSDYSFYFIKVDSHEKIWAEIYGTALAIPGTSAVYSASRYNNHFTKRDKYEYTLNGLKAIRQPFYYVGLKTYTLTPIALLSSPNGSQKIAELPQGAEIEVLATDGKPSPKGDMSYLVKTPFGLVGWVTIPQSQYYSTVIEGLSWWGD